MFYRVSLRIENCQLRNSSEVFLQYEQTVLCSYEFININSPEKCYTGYTYVNHMKTTSQ